MLWPFFKRTRLQTEHSYDDSLETYISHATADGAGWNDEVPYASLQPTADDSQNNTESTS